MKKIIKTSAALLLAILFVQGKAQSLTAVCFGSSATLTAINSLSLMNASYSINPGGVTSVNPTFVVTPTTATTYTLYTTGTNTNSTLVTTSSTVNVIVNSITYSLVSSSGGFTLGCGSNSVCNLNIANVQTAPVPGGSVSYTVFAPGSSVTVPAGTLNSIVANTTLYTPGTWTVLVRDNTNLCNSWSTVNVTTNTVSPDVSNVSVSQNPLTCANPAVMVQITPTASVQFYWLPSGVQGNSIVVGTNSATPSQTMAVSLTLVATETSNSCQSSTIIPVYQNLFIPNAIIAASAPLFPCTSTLVLTNTSTSGIPWGVFPITQPVSSYLWEGPPPQPTLALASTYIAQTPGIYTMSVMDGNNGCKATATINIASSMLTPVTAAFSHTNNNGVVTFNSVSTGTYAGTTFFWDFGDGTGSMLQNPTHTYVSAGSHLVKLKVVNFGLACVDSVIQSVNVSGIPCVANSGFTVVPTGTVQVWNAIPAYPWNIAAASWNWGDGSTSNTLYTSHQYSAAGFYNICLSVTVSCVGSSSTCTSYNIYRMSQENLIREVRVKAPELVTGLALFGSEEQLFLNILPNPNQGEFELAFTNFKAKAIQLSIYDLTGCMVHTRTIDAGTSTVAVSTAGLSSGIYLVRLQADDLILTRRMVIKQ